MGAGGALLVFAMRRFGRRWWAPGAALVVAFGVIVTYASPIVLDPLFNRFEPLPAGELRRDVLELAERADVQVGEVYVMDASRRTTAANAYVAGLGTTKRVVLYDNLLEDFSPAEVRLVVAHELATCTTATCRAGCCSWPSSRRSGCCAVARIAERLAPDGLGRPAAVPAVALAIALVVPGITFVSNRLSRAVEARADRYAMELTRDPDGLVAFQRRIARPERLRPRPAALGPRPARHAPDRDRADRPGARVQSARGGRRRCTSGRLLMPSLVCHLDQLSSIASISSRMKRGETLMRATTTPGISSLSTSWSTRAKVIVNS